MKTRKICYIFILLLLLPATSAMAQQGRALILLDGFRQAANLSYEYNGETSDSDGKEILSRDHNFTEAYRFDIDYGIYSARLLQGHLSAELKLDQEMFSNTGQPSGNSVGHEILYNLNGVFLGRHPYPVSFYANSGISKVQRTFAGSFDQATDNYGTGFFLKNRYIPLQINYNRSKIATSGLANDREHTLENFTLIAKHKVKDFSNTSAELSFSSFDTDTKGDISFSESFLTNDFAISNQLTWDSKGKGRSLSTSYRYRQEGGDRESNTSDFSEALTWDFGKAFKAGARYTNSYQNAGSQTKHENNGDVWLRHMLFQNLQTSAILRGRTTDFPNGTEQDAAVTFSADYQKILPAASRLQLGISQTYGVTDRKVAGDTIIRESQRIDVTFFTFFDSVDLKPDVIPGTIIVRNGRLPITYLEGPDYTVAQTGRITTISIILGGAINDGDILLVEYQVNTNPSIKYGTDNRSIYGALMFDERRWRIFAGWDEYVQNFLSGRLDPTNLLNSRTYRAGLEFNGKTATFRAEYTDHESTSSVFQSLDGTFRYTKDFTASTLTVHVKDRVTVRENPPSALTGTVAGGTSNESDTENAFGAGAIYRRPLLNLANLKLTADYLNVMGQNRKDALSLGLIIKARIGKIVAELKSDIHWLVTDVSTRRDDLVQLDITRYF